MRTEEYIIILVGVVANGNEVLITYTSNAPENHTLVTVSYSNGMVIKIFEHVKNAEKGVLSMPAAGLLPGTYTCDIAIDNDVKDSKKFIVN